MAEFSQIMDYCKGIFVSKMQDYGTAWRILRLPSLTDQLFIKVQRVRTLQQIDTQTVADDPQLDVVGVINYTLMALMQLRLGVAASAEEAHMAPDQVLAIYDEEVGKVRDLLQAKNHDYGEAWRDMRVTSLTDQLFMRVLRIKQIEDNGVSEGDIKSIYRDIVNYAVFSLILLEFCA